MEPEVNRFVVLASEMIARIESKPKDWHRDVARLSYDLEVTWRTISPPPKGPVRWPAMLVVEVDEDEPIPVSGFYSEIIEARMYRELLEKIGVWGVATCLTTDPFTEGATEFCAWQISDSGKTEINAEFASNVAECLSTWIRWIETYEDRPVNETPRNSQIDSVGTTKKIVAVGYLKDAGVPQSSAYRMLKPYGETISTDDLESLKQVARDKAAKRDRGR